MFLLLWTLNYVEIHLDLFSLSYTSGYMDLHMEAVVRLCIRRGYIDPVFVSELDRTRTRDLQVENDLYRIRKLGSKIWYHRIDDDVTVLESAYASLVLPDLNSAGCSHTAR